MTGAASPPRRRARRGGVFAKRFPMVWKQIEALETPHTRPVEAAGEVVNIDLGGALLYPQPERAWLDSQMAAFAADPDRLVFDNPAHCNLTPISLKLLDDLVSYVRDEKLVAKMAPQPVVDVGYLFVFGIGLGHHILELLEKTPARHVVLIEPVKEFLLHSFDAIDWRKVIARADRRNITLHFILAEHPEDICLQVEGLISRNGNVFLDGSYLLSALPVVDLPSDDGADEGAPEGLLHHQRIFRRRDRNDPQLPRQPAALGLPRHRERAGARAELSLS